MRYNIFSMNANATCKTFQTAENDNNWSGMRNKIDFYLAFLCFFMSKLLFVCSLNLHLSLPSDLFASELCKYD